MDIHDIIEGLAYARRNFVEPTAVVIHPSDLLDLLKAKEFVDMCAFNVRQTGPTQGEIGQIFGLKVIVSVSCTPGQVRLVSNTGIIEELESWNPSSRFSNGQKW